MSNKQKIRRSKSTNSKRRNNSRKRKSSSRSRKSQFSFSSNESITSMSPELQPDVYRCLSSNKQNGIRSTTMWNVMKQLDHPWTHDKFDRMVKSVLTGSVKRRRDPSSRYSCVFKRLSDNKMISVQLLKQTDTIDLENTVKDILKSAGTKPVLFENIKGDDELLDIYKTILKVVIQEGKLALTSFKDNDANVMQLIAAEKRKFAAPTTTSTRVPGGCTNVRRLALFSPRTGVSLSTIKLNSTQLSSPSLSPLVSNQEKLAKRYEQLRNIKPPSFSNEQINLLRKVLKIRAKTMALINGYEYKTPKYVEYLGLEDEIPAFNKDLKTRLNQKISVKVDDGVARVYDEKGVEISFPRVHLNHMRSYETSYRILINDAVVESISKRLKKEELDEFTKYISRAADEEQAFPSEIQWNRLPVADLHLHFGGSLSQSIILGVILKQLNSSEIVYKDPNGNEYNLKGAFELMGVQWRNLTQKDLKVDGIDISDFFTFESKFTLFDNEILHNIIFGRNGMLRGRLIYEMWLEELKERKKYNVSTEVRISVSGKNKTDLPEFASFFRRYSDLLENFNLKLALQTPRNSSGIIASGKAGSFAEILHNVWQPIFDAFDHPNSDVYWLLMHHVTAVDLVGDEGKRTQTDILFRERPSQMSSVHLDVGYPVWSFYYYGIVAVWNLIRTARGILPVAFSPHSLEAPAVTENGLFTFFLAHNCAHGRMLSESPTETLLFWISQIQMKLSLKSNEQIYKLMVPENPFMQFHQMGLNVIWSSDDSMLFSRDTQGMLLEQILATDAYGLSFACVAEIKRRSIVGSPWQKLYQNDSNAQYGVPEIREFHRKVRYEKLLDLLQLSSGSQHW